MPVFFPFGLDDIQQSLVNTSPLVQLASGTLLLNQVSGSGTTGWRGNPELGGPSGSLSLYEGIRARTDVGPFTQITGTNVDPNTLEPVATSGLQMFPIDLRPTYSIEKVQFISGSYPATASVQFVKCRNTDLPDNPYTGLPDPTQLTDTDWYDEHFAPIGLLYDFYGLRKPDFFIGSYDYYSLYFYQVYPFYAPTVFYDNQLESMTVPTGSFMLTAWIKPSASLFANDYLTSSLGRAYGIMSALGTNGSSSWAFFLTGSAATPLAPLYPAFMDSNGVIVTASQAVTMGEWQQVAFLVGNGTGSFYIDLDYAGGLHNSYSPLINPIVSSSGFAVGSMFHLTPSGSLRSQNGFDGFMFETRVWANPVTGSSFSYVQLSSSWNTTLVNSSSLLLQHYSRFNDGPLATYEGIAQGSGVMDYAPNAVPGAMNIFFDIAAIYNAPPYYLPTEPIWQLNDCEPFYPIKEVAQTGSNGPISFLRVLHCPSMFYGRAIATGSIELVCNRYSKQGIQRILVDDGRGNLYLSGSTYRPYSGEDCTGVVWNKAGNVFYDEGLVVVTEPSLWDFGVPDQADQVTGSDCLSVQFAGTTQVTALTYNCRLGATDANGSNNPSFATYDSGSDSYLVNNLDPVEGPVTWISAVGIYNENHELVAVAKLASPIRKREGDKVTLRLREDF